MSENFIVSARKYRPKSWETVVGQKTITATLQNAIANDQIAQAYLFCGPRGVGKTTSARIFAREINHDAQAQDEDLSFNVFELDAASNNSVEDIRSLTDQVRIPPQIGKYKVYIIDEVHMLSQAAFNAFLKTLEEPPPHAIFILATTEKHKIIPTILSRCQIFDFNRIRVDDMVEHLKGIAEKEGVNAEADALHIVALKADGALRDALSIFDQLVAFCGKELTYDNVIENLNVLDYDYYFKMTEHFLKEDISETLMTFDQILDKGFDAHHFITGLGEHFRNLLVCKDPQTVSLLEVGETIRERYVQQAQEVGVRMLVQGLEFINNCDVSYKTSNNQRLLAEFTLIKIASINHNFEEKKNNNFVLKPFVGSFVKQVKKPVRSAAAEAVVKPNVPGLTNSPKIAEKPILENITTEKRSYGSPVLTELLKPKDPESQILREGSSIYSKELRNTPFSPQEFKTAWKDLITKLKKEDKIGLYNALANEEPVLQDFKITVPIHNTIQESAVKMAQGELLSYLKNSLSNDNLEIATVFKEEAEKSVHFYTDQDKYNLMKEKKPEIEYFRKKFNLDIEF